MPKAYYSELFFHRPEEFIPAIFFLLALFGYLKKGHWKTDSFEHWLILSLIVNVMGQVMFMSFSGSLFDTMFDSAHLLKKISYIFVLVGLLINIYIVYKKSEQYTKQLSETNNYFKTIIDDVVQVSQGLAKGNLNIMPKANYQGDFIQIKKILETALANQSEVITDISQVAQGLAKGNLKIIPKANYQGEFVQIKTSLEAVLYNQNQVITDISQVAQGLASGNLTINPKAEYNGDFIQIKSSLQIILSDLTEVIDDIVQMSYSLANGDNVQAKAEYQGNFIQIKEALETASNKLFKSTTQNAAQNWIKNGQSDLNILIRGEQDIIVLAKNIITFLCKYVDAQVGLFYLLSPFGKVKTPHL